MPKKKVTEVNIAISMDNGKKEEGQEQSVEENEEIKDESEMKSEPTAPKPLPSGESRYDHKIEVVLETIRKFSRWILILLGAFYIFRLGAIIWFGRKLSELGESDVVEMVTAWLSPKASDMLTVLIALFGIVISVWVALNIYNVMGKDELFRLEEKEDALSKELDQKTGELQKAIKAANDSSYSTTFSVLLNIIAQNTAHYASGQYLQMKFQPWQDKGEKLGKWGSTLLSYIIHIEALFLSASDANRSKHIVERISLAKDGNKCCQRLRSLIAEMKRDNVSIDEELMFMNGYLALREGDFFFYEGYRQSDGHGVLSSAVSAYRQALKIWFPDKDGETFDGYSEEDLFCLAYLHNVIGECLNVKRQKPMRSTLAEDPTETERECDTLVKQALAEFECAIRFIEKIAASKKRKALPEYFSVYYRNLGTALDNLGSEECLEQYERALKINPADYLSHQTIAAYFLKRISETESVKHITQIEQTVLPHSTLLILKNPCAPQGYNLACWAHTLLSYAYHCIDDIEAFNEHYAQAIKYLKLSEPFPDNAETQKKNLERIRRLLE